MQRKFYIIVYLEMIEEATERRLSRRTRSERTKRRERYLLRNCANKCENDIYTYNISASSADSVQLPTINDFYNRRNIEMGNKKMVWNVYYLCKATNLLCNERMCYDYLVPHFCWLFKYMIVLLTHLGHSFSRPPSQNALIFKISN